MVFLAFNWRTLLVDWLRNLETAFISAGLAVLGFVAGTPKALLWMSFYFKRMIPAALRFASYGRGPDSTIGLYGQWGTFQAAVGEAVYTLFLIALLWFVVRLLLNALGKVKEGEFRARALFVLSLSIIVFDLPFLMSYNYVPRFFLPFLPMFAILAGLFLEDLLGFFKSRLYVIYSLAAGAVLVVLLAFMQVVSVALLFANDARMPAGRFIETLEPDTVLEYTLYPPSIVQNYFARTRNYPIYLVKYPGETVPTNKPYRYNVGRNGLADRGVDYLVVDSFTYARFSDAYICETNPVECDFFTRLIAGETDLRLLASFEYHLPPFLPQVSLAAVNPVVKVYEVPR